MIDTLNPAFDAADVAPRYKIELDSSILVTAVETSGTEEYYFFQGRLLDVSVSGLAIMISDKDKTELDRLGSQISLQFMLPLPSQAIELVATPARFQKSDDNSDKWLLGAHITDMSGRDRIVFMEFIHEHETL